MPAGVGRHGSPIDDRQAWVSVEPGIRQWTVPVTMCIVWPNQTHEGDVRTNIDIDDDLLAKAMAATGLTTKKATVEEALRRLVRQRERLDALADMSGLGWEGDLPATREGRETDPHR